MKKVLSNTEQIDIQQLKKVEEYFFKTEVIKSSKEFAALIGENDNGLSDIKAGRKKLKFENLRDLKISHPEINLHYFIDPKESMLVRNNTDMASEIMKEHIENKHLITHLSQLILTLNKEIEELKNKQSDK